MRKNNGLLLVASAYTLWGLLPGYWKLLSSVKATEVLAHRIIWSALFLGFILAARGELFSALSRLRDGKVMRTLLCSTALITVNWLTYVWALGKGYFIESGLGYYLCPLCIVALGCLVLGERLDNKRRIAIGVTAAGVLLKIFASRAFPLIAISLALTFSFYTLLRKTAAIKPLEGLFIETAAASVPACLYLGYLAWTGNHAFMRAGEGIDLLLMASGAITALPMLMLVSGAPQVSLQTMGVLQFIAPTLTVLVGLLQGEVIPAAELPAYLIIWSGIAIYLFPAVRRIIYQPDLNFSK